jgi:hypothetical protein
MPILRNGYDIKILNGQTHPWVVPLGTTSRNG